MRMGGFKSPVLLTPQHPIGCLKGPEWVLSDGVVMFSVRSHVPKRDQDRKPLKILEILESQEAILYMSK